MRVTPVLAVLALGLLAAAPEAMSGDTMRCGNRIVSTEAVAGEVLAACGRPDYRDSWSSAPTYAVDEELWYYNFGSRQFVRVLRFTQGRLVSIASDGYGFDTPSASSCAPTDVVKGLSAFRLLHRCGAPLTRESFDQVYPLRDGDPAQREGAVRPIHGERWVYDFGADTRMRIVTLRNSRVVDIELGNNGSVRAGY